jgi:hypothetical protein
MKQEFFELDYVTQQLVNELETILKDLVEEKQRMDIKIQGIKEDISRLGSYIQFLYCSYHRISCKILEETEFYKNSAEKLQMEIEECENFIEDLTVWAHFKSKKGTRLRNLGFADRRKFKIMS